MPNRIHLIQGDITKIKVDAIVNAANSALRGGGGVDGAIHRAGGPTILEECRKIGRCQTGQAVYTTAGNLPAKFVIHTVGPIYRNGKSREAELLAAAYRNSLELARELKCESIAFPCISTGVYRFPIEEAAKIEVREISKFLAENESMKEVQLVCFDEDNFKALQKALDVE
jgi:O-acetyl-ADP-ribose deacetylase